MAIEVVETVLRTLLNLGRDRRGSVTIMSSVLLPIVIGVVALVAEFGSGLLTRVENQRVADLAAFAGAIAYNSSGSTTTMNAAIAKVATLNGMPTGTVSGTLVTSPTGSGNQAVSVTVSTSKLLLLAPVLGSNSSLTINAGAQAEIAAQATGCIIALNGSGTGVTLSGGTSVTAANCAVASNSTVTVPCGTYITTKYVNYNSSTAPSEPCSGIQPPSGTSSVRIIKASTSDPLSGNSGVSTATSRLATVAAYTAPTATFTTTGTSIDFAWDQTATKNAAIAAGCTAAFSGSTWTLTCPAGTRNFGNITAGGGITVNFNTGGAATNVYNFSGSISATNGSTALSFGPGTYNVAAGVTVSGGTPMVFGAGTFKIGQSTSSCNGSGTYSICVTGSASITFGGPSTFTLPAGISNNGQTSITFGSGSTNSYAIGAGSTGDALNMSGSAKTLFADATGTTFKLVGNVNLPGGGTCLGFPVASQHDIKGFLSASGGVVLGAGNYTVTGYVALGATSGGNVSCWGSSVGVSGTNVTLTIGASSTVSCGYYPVTTSGFCIGSGYQNVTLVAPSSGTYANLAVIGPVSSTNSAGASFTAGASGTSISGALYFPYGPVTLSGGASLGGGTGQCLQVIGSQVTLSGGTAVASACISSSSSGSGSALLVR